MKEILLNTNNKNSKHYRTEVTAKVDDEDFEYLNKLNWSLWICRNSIYARTTIYSPLFKNGKKTLLMHRVILKVEDPKIVVDHKDANGLNNQKNNIRTTSHLKNSQNRRVNRKDNGLSIYKGVCNNSGKFRARITVSKVQIYLGNFDNSIDAAKAYNKAAIKYFGEFALLNSLPENQKI